LNKNLNLRQSFKLINRLNQSTTLAIMSMRTATPQYVNPTQLEESDDEEYEPTE